MIPNIRSYTPQEQYNYFKAGYRIISDSGSAYNSSCNACSPFTPAGVHAIKPAGTTYYVYSGDQIQSSQSLDDVWEEWIVLNGGMTTGQLSAKQAADLIALETAQAAKAAAEADAIAQREIALKIALLDSPNADFIDSATNTYDQAVAGTQAQIGSYVPSIGKITLPYIQDAIMGKPVTTIDSESPNLAVKTSNNLTMIILIPIVLLLVVIFYIFRGK